MAWTIDFSDAAFRVLRKLDKPTARRIRDALKEISFLDDPRSRGKALTGDMAGFWRYRVGDYRVICSIEDSALVVLVIDVGHRKDIYK